MGNGKKHHTPGQIANLLRQIDAAIASGKTKSAACNEAGITVQTFYRWRKEFSDSKPDQGKRLKHLEQENERLKLLVAELSLEKHLLQEIARGSV
jgi:putative transposase